jgi:hypothetical protein
VVTDGLEHEAERVQPEGDEVRRRVLRELLGLMDYLTAQLHDSAMD